jgi:hypothetical protein
VKKELEMSKSNPKAEAPQNPSDDDGDAKDR